MKKILYLHAGSEFYGADKVLRDLIAGLDKTQFEAHVILPNNGILVSKLQEAGAIVSVIEYPILRRKYFNPKGILEYVTQYQKYSKQLVDYARRHQIDVIHNNTTAVLEGIYLKQKLSLPLIWHVHEIIVKPKFISSFINRLMGKYADKIVTVSKAVQNHITTSPYITPDQVSVIYNGVDNAIFYPKESKAIREQFAIGSDKRVVGMVGRVNAWKGQKDFVKAVVPILKADDNIVAFMAGGVFEGEEWRIQELEQVIADTGVKNQFIRIDYYPNPAELYNLFDVFVLPSTNPDPLPTVVLEAMACGKPVVSYRHGGATEMIKENYNGVFATPNNPQELGMQIQSLLSYEEKLQTFGQNSIERQRKEFSLKSYVEHFSEVYNQF